MNLAQVRSQSAIARNSSGVAFGIDGPLSTELSNPTRCWERQLWAKSSWPEARPSVSIRSAPKPGFAAVPTPELRDILGMWGMSTPIGDLIGQPRATG